MRDFRDAKAMAQTLREALKTKSVSLTHSESLELVATILGFRDWNVLSATIQSEVQPPANPGSTIPATVRLAAQNQLPTLPVRDIVVFPHLNVPLFAGRAKTISAVERAMAEDRRILVVTQRRPGDDNPTAADLYGVGLTASVTDLIKLNDGTIKLLVKTLTRATIVRLVEDPFLTAEIAPFDESRGQRRGDCPLSRGAGGALRRTQCRPDQLRIRPIPDQLRTRPIAGEQRAGHIGRCRRRYPHVRHQTKARPFGDR